MGLGIRILCDLYVLYSFLLFVCHDRVAETAANIIVKIRKRTYSQRKQ